MHEERPESVPSHLACREIQAPLVSALIKRFAEVSGEDEAQSLAREVIRLDAVRAGEMMADRYGGNSLEILLQIVEEVWAADGTMEIRKVRVADEALEFEVSRCGYAEMYQRLGIREMGCLLSCDRDFTFLEGFNPDLELMRSQTIMEGADYCDFRYQKRPSDGEFE